MITRAGRPSPAITAGLACGVVGVAILGGPSWGGPAGAGGTQEVEVRSHLGRTFAVVTEAVGAHVRAFTA
ncbi:MAG: hypothetical protein ACKOJI_13565, partial [Phycisphaerales bacterium]